MYSVQGTLAKCISVVHKICHFYLNSLKKIVNVHYNVLQVACTLISDCIQYIL